MCHGSLDDIRAYARNMVTMLGRPQGGFIPRRYDDPVGAGHRMEAVNVMCEEILAASHARYSR